MNLFFVKEEKKREEINESIAEMSQTVVDLKREFVETTPGVETSWKADIVDGIKESMREFTVGTSAPNIAEAADSARARVSPAQESRPADDRAVRIRGLPESCGLMNEMMKNDKEEAQKLLDHMEVEVKILDVRRLGLPAEGRTRTMLVTLDSSFTKRMVLASLAKLRSYEKKRFFFRLIFLLKKLNSSRLL